MRFAALLPTVFAAMTLIVIGDTAGKLLTQADVAPVFVAWARFALGALLVLPLAGLRAAEIRDLVAPRVMLRGALIVGGISFILTALQSVPLADAFGAFFIGPVVAFVLSVLFLREHVTPLRSLLIVLGFAGVLLVVQPGGSFKPAILFAVLAGCFHGGYVTVTRWLAGAYRARLLLLAQLCFGAVVLAPFAWMAGAPQIDAGLALLLVISAVGSAAGNFLLVVVSRHADGSLIAPLIYTQLIAATGIGWLTFGDLPNMVALAGLALILTSGLGSLVAAHRGRISAPPSPDPKTTP